MAVYVHKNTSMYINMETTTPKKKMTRCAILWCASINTPPPHAYTLPLSHPYTQNEMPRVASILETVRLISQCLQCHSPNNTIFGLRIKQQQRPIHHSYTEN